MSEHFFLGAAATGSATPFLETRTVSQTNLNLFEVSFQFLSGLVQGGANRRDPAEIIHKFVAVDHAVEKEESDSVVRENSV